MFNPGYAPVPMHMLGYRDERIPRYRNAPLMLEYQVTPSLCPTCHNIKPPKPSADQKVPRIPDKIEIYLVHFLATSKLGCPFCSLLLSIFQRFVETAEKYIARAARHNWNLSVNPSSIGIKLVLEPDQPIRIIINEGIGPEARVHAQLLCYRPSGIPPQIPLGVHLLTPSEHKISQWPGLFGLGNPSDPSTDDGLQFFKDQIENCTMNHPKCRTDDEPMLPKRVLDVGADENDGIKLCEPNGTHGKYAALSHRWCEPSTPMLTTTKATLSEHLGNIAWDNLPKTLQDAIRISRKLGLRYLWVDTLCIIQDGDPDNDKESELPKMGTYYANAFCTIAAASSKNSTESFLQVRDESYRPVEFEFGSDNSTVHVRRFGVVGTLANRAWTWQESALSRRILNFAPSELIWECKSELKSECGYEPRFTPSLGLPQRFEDAAKHPLDCWRQVVQSYSARELTHDEDILPAISGLAQKTFDAAKSQYLAGLWRADLPWGLLWEVIRGPTDPLPVLPEQYTAPSWSWASIKGQVRTCNKPFGQSVQARGSFDSGSVPIYPVVQVFAAECNLLARQNPFGKVSGGFVTLNGFPIWTILTCDHNMTSGWTFRVQSPTGLVMPILPDTVIEEFDLQPAPARIPARTVRRAKSGRQKKIFRAPVLCLPVAMLSGTEPGCICYAGIVLALSEICPDAFTRIGAFRCRRGFFDGCFYYTVTSVQVR
jgi:hypothetical protein